jgi:hypothetical protein
VGHDEHGEDRADRNRPRQGLFDYNPDFPGHALAPGVHVRRVVPPHHCGLADDELRARRVNLVSALVYVVTLPFVAITATYLYFDLLVRHTLEDEKTAESAVLPAKI